MILRLFRPVACQRLVVLLLTVAGCAGPMGPDRPGPSVPVAQWKPEDYDKVPVNAFDGSYRTEIHLTGSTDVAKGTDWCSTPGQTMITVANGRFTYTTPHPNVPGNPTPQFEASLAPDGSFYGLVLVGNMHGTIQGGHIEGQIDGAGCLYSFSGDRA
jgi:hypothetical protein